MKLLLGLLIGLVVATIVVGLRLFAKQAVTDKPGLKLALTGNLALFIPLVLLATFMVIPDAVYAATQAETFGSGMGYLAMALSTGLACIGCGIAVGSVGSSALGAVSEDEKILGKTLIFVGLAEGIAIYGLIISILIMGRL